MTITRKKQGSRKVYSRQGARKQGHAGGEKTKKDRLAAYRQQLELMQLELGIYRQVGGLVVRGSSRTKILNRIMDFALKAVGCDSGTLYLLDKHTSELRFEFVKGPLAKSIKGRKMTSEVSIAAEVARTARPYVSEDLAADPLWTGGNARRTGRNLLAVPLLLRKKVIGVIEVINKADGAPFTEDDEKVLTSLGNHFAIIMERGDLVSELDHRLNQLTTLNKVGNLLVSSLEHDVIRHRAMVAITRLMSAETGSLLLIDRESNELYFEVALGDKGRKLKEVRLSIGEGIAGWVAKHGSPVIIDDVNKDRRFQSKFDRRNEFRTRNMVCVPVRLKGSVIGVLQAINRTDGYFTKNDLSLFQLFSHQVAIALDNARLYEEVRDTFHATAGALAEAIEKRDPYTGGHTRRVLEYCLAIAAQLGLSKEKTDVLRLSAVLHDIGKIGIEDKVLRKGAPLDNDEATAMRKHPQYGAEILKHIPQLKDIIPGMLYHHERVDGKGYPEGLRDSKIPLISRIISVADTFDAMTTTRPYREGLTEKFAFEELNRYAGKQFDRKVVNAFMRAFETGEITNLAASGSQTFQ